MISGVMAALATAAAVAYPVVVYLGLTRWDIRWMGLVIAAVALAGLLLRRTNVLGSLAVVALAALSAAWNEPRFVLFVPVLFSGGLLVGFAATLRTGATPMIERFARLQQPVLSEDERRWCRLVTVVWCLFFAGNAATALVLAVAAPAAWWAAYTGGIAYVLIGLLIAGEYVARKQRFRTFGPNPVDRLLVRLLPRRAP